MARPHKCRWVGTEPIARAFKPAGVPCHRADSLELRLDELEALRLGDLEGLYHERAAEEMNVSRATFGRLIESARRKVAEALVHGKMLTIEGGVVTMNQERHFVCSACGHRFAVPCGTPRPGQCPECESENLHRDAEERGHSCQGLHGHAHHHHGGCDGHGKGHGNGAGHGHGKGRRCCGKET